MDIVVVPAANASDRFLVLVWAARFLRNVIVCPTESSALSAAWKAERFFSRLPHHFPFHVQIEPDDGSAECAVAAHVRAAAHGREAFADSTFVCTSDLNRGDS